VEKLGNPETSTGINYRRCVVIIKDSGDVLQAVAKTLASECSANISCKCYVSKTDSTVSLYPELLKEGLNHISTSL